MITRKKSAFINSCRKLDCCMIKGIGITFEVFETSKVLNARAPKNTFGVGKTPKVSIRNL